MSRVCAVTSVWSGFVPFCINSKSEQKQIKTVFVAWHYIEFADIIDMCLDDNDVIKVYATKLFAIT